MPPSTQNQVLEIVAKCLSVDTIVVFLDKNWRRPERGCQFILTYSNIPVLHPILLQISKSYLGDWQWYKSLKNLGPRNGNLLKLSRRKCLDRARKKRPGRFAVYDKVFFPKSCALGVDQGGKGIKIV
jgi:hypothetical protein